MCRTAKSTAGWAESFWRGITFGTAWENTPKGSSAPPRLGFQEPGLLAALFFVARGAYLLNKFSRRRDELIQKLLKLKR